MTIVQRIKNGLWYENPGLVQLLGLCPLLAVTSSFVNGLGLGLATLVVLTVSNGLVSATRRWIQPEIRIPIYVLIIASLVTCTELVFKAWFPDLDRVLGIFIPLIVTNCAILGRAESFASRNNVLPSIFDGLMMGIGFTFALVLLGVLAGTGIVLQSQRAETIEREVATLYGSAFPSRPAPANVIGSMRNAVRSAHERADFLCVYRGNLSALDLLTER